MDVFTNQDNMGQDQITETSTADKATPATTHDFPTRFQQLTGHAPFPWQETLYERFVSEPAEPASAADSRFPQTIDLPTGLGKTSLIALWLLALANRPDVIPRRLVYVVNRRTVVDQTTDEVEKYRAALLKPELAELQQRLKELCALDLIPLDPTMGVEPALTISTLRGQFADNRMWSADPARPAVICGTVDMIGSRLLFNGYGIGFKQRPLHAGFLGQDALLIHDEAHLEPAFQRLLETIVTEQQRCREYGRFHAIELTATPRGKGAFGLTASDRNQKFVKQRLNAEKIITLRQLADEKKLSEKIIALATEYRDSEQAIVIFVQQVKEVLDIEARLKKEKFGQVLTLTGTLRGWERDELVRRPIFVRFQPEHDRPPEIEPAKGTVFLISTSAGEVGVNLSADHLIGDLTTLDSIAQRLGRVNRFGTQNPANVEILYPTDIDEKDDYQKARARTATMLRRLEKDGSPANVSKLLKDAADGEVAAAFAPPPKMRDATDILFDSWALTSIRELPGRPPVEEYLHGVREWEPPRMFVAWREEVDFLNEEILEANDTDATELLDEFPLKPHELLHDTIERVLKELKKLAEKQQNDVPVWVIDRQQLVQATTLQKFLNRDKDELHELTVLLPPSVGGLTATGMLHADGDVPPKRCDVACAVLAEKSQGTNQPNTLPVRLRVWDEEKDQDQFASYRLIRTIDTDPTADARAEEFAGLEDDESPDLEPSTQQRFWHWLELPTTGDNDGSKTSSFPVAWQNHSDDVECNAKKIAAALRLPMELQQALTLAAHFHDFGKMRGEWQRSIGNPNPRHLLAKSGRYPIARVNEKLIWKRMQPREMRPYRHEFGSLLDLETHDIPDFLALSEDLRELVRHLIAAHHGFGRPHFPTEYVDDPAYDLETTQTAATGVPRRFARLQRRYGRWGLAYLESLLRAADWAASARPTKVLYDEDHEIEDSLKAQRRRECV